VISLTIATAPSLLDTRSAAARVAMVEQKLVIIGIARCRVPRLTEKELLTQYANKNRQIRRLHTRGNYDRSGRHWFVANHCDSELLEVS
jgi:hypothetical protein